jgi:hypothetical protein
MEESYKYRPGKCPEFKAKEDYFGKEQHSCPCGGTTTTCANCGGDYHEKPEEKAECHLKK